MTIEMIDEASTIQRSNSGNATGLNNVSPCENISVSHEVSAVIDAEAEQYKALTLEKTTLINQINELKARHEAELKPLWNQVWALDLKMKLTGPKPSCFAKLDEQLKKGNGHHCDSCVHGQTCYEAVVKGCC